MEDDILQVIEEEITNNPSLEEIKASLLQKGFQEHDITAALKRYSDRLDHRPTSLAMKKNIRLFTTKELFDRIGYGFSTHQFINVLFFQTAVLAGLPHLAYFIVGLFNGFKSIISVNISSFLQEYSKVYQVKKGFIKTGGIIFGFTFLVMAFARVSGMVWVFALALLVGSIGVVTYGDLFNKLLMQNLKKERMSVFLRKISQYGLLITAASLFISGYIMDFIPVEGREFIFMGSSFKAHGYLISFFITAIAFILSGYILAFIKQTASNFNHRFMAFFKEYRMTVKSNMQVFTHNKIIFLLMLASVFSGLAQTLGNSYYGIFIYENFSDQWLGGFLNIAVIYGVAILVSSIGPWLTKRLNSAIGLSPMLVFGTMLIAMMPLVAGWAPSIYALGVANSLSIIGSAMVGAAQGLLARKLLKEHERHQYFSTLSAVITIPFLILLPIGAWLAQAYSPQFIFKIIVAMLVVIVTPIYIILVAMANKRSKLRNVSAY